ncbi:MAG: glycerol kinase GlpK [Ectothiorhodospiraceae bacterium AqS1]|nr:glycerol kinase GlpK [Ectothiorhodospiraceae bacterium AqS1]
MDSNALLLAIDQGTTSSRAIVFEADGAIRSIAQREFTQHYPDSGLVEHDAEEIWETTLAVCGEAIAAAGGPIAAIGITNQRETTVVWDRDSGKPLHRAIVWQDRRTAKRCAGLRKAGHEGIIAAKTGLLPDPYFSGTKVAWILDEVEGARAAAEAGRLAFGTIDSFLIWRLTGGAVHATDATNASRTMLFDIHRQRWDEELLALLDIPKSVLPEVRDCAADYGETAPGLLPAQYRIAGVAGDQHAATIGQACFEPGMIKSTYGTGCFAMLNTGKTATPSGNRLLTTVAYRLNGEATYALEGSIFIAGAAVQWLRDGLGVIACASETEALARSLADNRGVYLVPAFTGLGAPHWDPNARGAIFGLARDSGPAHLARAALESVCYQTRDLALAMAKDSGEAPNAVRVDGGMVANDWLLQFLADMLDTPVDRPQITETTALGAAYLAGLQVGVYDGLDEIARQWRLERTFAPEMPRSERNDLLSGWDRAVAKVLDND